ncbi:GntR family transcriptional regulator [Variovorax sp. GB1P17]|uniref:GntR family transcriptional regulator n=1 Tax=Variovorax sp. GB1P17 TaxID=3443740 RepID=UPI003F448FCD
MTTSKNLETASQDETMPKRASGSPLYMQVLETLRRNILDGVFEVGGTLPTEAELSTTFGVSRHTIREALRQLRADGLVTSRQGSGSTVASSASPEAFVHEVDAISDLIQYAASMTFRVDGTEVVEAEGELAASLQTPPGTKWLRIEGVRHATLDEHLVCATTVYVPMEYATVNRLVGRTTTAIYELIEGLFGVRIVEVEQTVRARTIPQAFAAALEVDPDSTVIEVVRIYRLQSGKIAEVAVNLYRPERFKLSMKLRKRG